MKNFLAWLKKVLWTDAEDEYVPKMGDNYWDGYGD